MPGVRLTTLTKVLHRKRPLFIPLHDGFVAACYLDATPGYPVRHAHSRTWVAYWTDMSRAIESDIRQQPGHWAELRRSIPADVPPLRLLDVVAWRAGRSPSAYL